MNSKGRYMRVFATCITWGVAAIMAVAPASARVISVERDGSGDYVVIQEALDAAATGDTVSIGSGIYSECRSYTLPGWQHSLNIYAYVQQDSITIQGSGPGLVVIGPGTPQNDGQFGPKGIALAEPGYFVAVTGVTVANCYDGLYVSRGSGSLRLSSIEQCYVGASILESNGFLVEDSTVTGDGIGIYISGSHNSTVSRCSISTHDYCVVYGGSNNTTVTESQLQLSTYALLCDSGLSGVISGNVFAGVERAIGVSQGVSATITSNVIEASGYGIRLYATDDQVVIADNIISGGSLAPIMISAEATTTPIHGNHIMRGSGYAVIVDSFGYDEGAVVDLTGNYWGTAERDSIQAWILDDYGDPDSPVIVFEPFSSTPLSRHDSTMSDLKEMFR